MVLKKGLILSNVSKAIENEKLYRILKYNMLININAK